MTFKETVKYAELSPKQSVTIIPTTPLILECEQRKKINK
jgi:hypothetical protein